MAKKKKYKLRCQFIFEGDVIIKAESKSQAEEYFEKHVGLVLGGHIHTTLPDDEIDWEFNVHPDKVIIHKDEE